MKNTSLCGLGQTAPNPTLSTLRFFRNEYEQLLQPDKFGPRGNGEPKNLRWRNNWRIRYGCKTLTIDGKPITAEEGATCCRRRTRRESRSRRSATSTGFYDVGACRLCLVEVTGVPKLLPACTTKVAEGMDVKTDSERLRKYRRMTLELLFAERNHVCSTCVRTAIANCKRSPTRRAWTTSATNICSRNGTWTPRIGCSAWTTTAASFALAACASAGTSRARARRTSPGAARSRTSSPISTCRGAKAILHAMRQVRPGLSDWCVVP